MVFIEFWAFSKECVFRVYKLLKNKWKNGVAFSLAAHFSLFYFLFVYVLDLPVINTTETVKENLQK